MSKVCTTFSYSDQKHMSRWSLNNIRTCVIFAISCRLLAKWACQLEILGPYLMLYFLHSTSKLKVISVNKSITSVSSKKDGNCVPHPLNMSFADILSVFAGFWAGLKRINLFTTCTSHAFACHKVCTAGKAALCTKQTCRTALQHELAFCVCKI